MTNCAPDFVIPQPPTNARMSLANNANFTPYGGNDGDSHNAGQCFPAPPAAQAFTRNRYRSTMPVNLISRNHDLPITPRTNPYIYRLNANQCASPGMASNSTTFNEPWSSTFVESPSGSAQNSMNSETQTNFCPKEQYEFSPSSSRRNRKQIRRSVSMLAANSDKAEVDSVASAPLSQNEENKKSEEEKRPKITFGTLGKSFFKKFNNSSKPNPSKNPNQKYRKSPVRTQAPTSLPSQPVPSIKVPSTSSSSTQVASVAKGLPSTVVNANCKMQQEERMKMFKKVGMKQSMKMSTVQRMQKERQRDFSLVAEANGRKRLSSNEAHDPTIDSMMLVDSPSKKTRPSMSLTDSDCSVIMRNKDKKTGQEVRFDLDARKIVATSMPMPMTSTPKTFGTNSRPTSASFEVSKLNSPSNSSLCLVAAEDEMPPSHENNRDHQDTTMYYSTNTLPALGTTSIKQEPEDDSNFGKNQTHSQQKFDEKISRYEDSSSPCSFASSTQCSSVTSTSAQPNTVQMAALWSLSQSLKEKRKFVEHARPEVENMKFRLFELEQKQKRLLQINQPTYEELHLYWNAGKEEQTLRSSLNMTEISLTDAENAILILKEQRDSLLNSSPENNEMTISNC